MFGCGGDRDPGKRPQMGAIAAALADRIVVTSDNPRSEDPAAIANAIVKGVRDAGHRRWAIEIDRRAAIARRDRRGASAATSCSIAGKGHETYQERNGERTPFSDAREAERGARRLERRMMDTATAARVVAGRVVGGNVPLPARDDRQPRRCARAISSSR